MSWQEELRKLDEELAAGRISADDYRVRRDQVLSSAVTQGESATPQSGDSSGGQQQPEKPAADSTQVISPVSQQQGDQHQAQPQSAADSNQPAPSVGSPPQQQTGGPAWQAQPAVAQSPNQQTRPPSPAGGFQQPPQQPWNAPEQDMTPPWGGSEFPPMGPHGDTVRTSQRAKAFDEPTEKRGGKIAAIAIVAVLVLGGLGTGGYFLFSGGGERALENTSATRGKSTAPATSAKPLSPNEKLMAMVPPLPGAPNQASGLHTPDELSEIGALSEKEASMLTEQSADIVAWRGSRKQPNEFGPEDDKFSVMVIPMSTDQDAQDLAGEISKYHTDNGLVEIPEPLPSIPEEVTFLKTPKGSPGIYLGIWTSNDNLVRVQVTQDPLDNEAALSGSYQRAAKSMLKKFPVTG